MSGPVEADIAVVGTGPTGLAAALALGKIGPDVVLVGPDPDDAPTNADRRTTALLGSSIEFLKNLGVWGACSGAAAPLTGIRIVDDRGGLLRAPEVLFRASEIGLTSFGANIPNSALKTALRAGVEGAESVRWIKHAMKEVRPGDTRVRLELEAGAPIDASLVIAADGRQSLTRAAAALEIRAWSYPQAALACGFEHSRAHDGITIELHSRSGPLTTVPLPGKASSLVWVEQPEEAQRIAKLSDEHFAAALEERLQGLLGTISDVGPRAIYPLSGLEAEHMGRNRVALVGEAARVIAPIGAQGLNLALRDVATLADYVADASASGGDVGGIELLRGYDRARAADAASRSVSVDLLNRSLLSDFVPLHALRGVGLHLLANIPAFRRFAMQRGLGPDATSLPRLMRPAVTG